MFGCYYFNFYFCCAIHFFGTLLNCTAGSLSAVFCFFLTIMFNVHNSYYVNLIRQILILSIMCTKDFLCKCEFWRNMPFLYHQFSVLGHQSVYQLEFLFEGSKKTVYTKSPDLGLPSLVDSNFIGLYVQPYRVAKYQSDLVFFKDFIRNCKKGQVDYFLTYYVKWDSFDFISFVRSL